VHHGALFDFDGTLVDTFGGIVEGVQRMRARLHAAPLPFEETKRHIGWGIRNLVGMCHPKLDAQRPERGQTDRLPLDGTPLPFSEAELEEIVELFREEYRQCQLHETRVYEGIGELCADLVKQGAQLAIVSNKPERFVRHITAALGLTDFFSLIVGGDSLPTLKPDPAPLHHAIAALDIDPGRCAMVGDSDLDIEAARAAGPPSIGVTWGISNQQEMEGHCPTYIAGTSEELARQLRLVLGMRD